MQLIESILCTKVSQLHISDMYKYTIRSCSKSLVKEFWNSHAIHFWSASEQFYHSLYPNLSVVPVAYFSLVSGLHAFLNYTTDPSFDQSSKILFAAIYSFTEKNQYNREREGGFMKYRIWARLNNIFLKDWALIFWSQQCQAAAIFVSKLFYYDAKYSRFNILWKISESFFCIVKSLLLDLIVN